LAVETGKQFQIVNLALSDRLLVCCIQNWTKVILFSFCSVCSFICQVASVRRRQQSDLYGLQVKLPPVTTSLTTER